MALLKLGHKGWCRTKPPQELLQANGLVQCSILDNYIVRDKKLKKTPGTSAYNTSLGSLGIPFIMRSYHIQADGEIVKRTHCYYDRKLYWGNDSSGALTETNLTTLGANVLPRFFIIQEAENSIAYLLTGKDSPKKYNGNGSYLWDDAGGDIGDIFNYTDAVVHLDRAFYVKHQSSALDYSESLAAETIEDTVIIGQDKDSFNVRVVIGANETLFVFKNNSIYQLYGRTPSQFQFRKVTDKYGLATKRGIYPVGNGFVFLNTFDKELYWFGGTESSIKPMTEEDIRLREIINHTPQALENVDMTVADGLFRFAFQHKESAINSNNCELVYCITEPDERGLPKWSLIKGSNVWCYSVWDKYGDRELLTGRSNIGKIMYNNRGHKFDDVPIITQFRTAEVVASEDMTGRFTGFFIKGKPTAHTVTSTFQYFVNANISKRGESSIEMFGEYRTIGTIKLITQELFNNRIIPLTENSRGNSIAFGLYDQNETDLEIYSISFGFEEKYIIRNIY